METLANRLARLRVERGFETQDALAKAAKIRQSFIGALEAGNQQSSGYLPEIARALGVDAYYLKTGIEVIVAGDLKINEVVDLMQKMDSTGKSIILDKSRDIAREYPLAKQTVA